MKITDRTKEYICTVNGIDIKEGDEIEFNSCDGMVYPNPYKVEKHIMKYEMNSTYIGYHLPWKKIGTLYSVDNQSIKVIRKIHDK